ncbi:(2Fe-2S)-binding protein [Kozakia baliensis]|uniref:Bacterioferritin-associated ferredoxin n=1 Tax=Kozakia baliensis TaxID=153496 RepID=A0A1D8UWJ1_9PROT|nr:(2Fe-2S)-binding protein [Kozakia baliensis]AOX18014.1 bacterioferritin [Kozakia baliensis]GEL64226.1 hypothetical protein KBA01_15120 [Kozakia baliensis]
MIVCSCNALTNHDVEDAVRKGASRPREIYASKGCKAQCGNCVPGMVCALKSLLQARKTQQTYVAAPEALRAMASA